MSLGLWIMSRRHIQCGVGATAAESVPLVRITIEESAGVAGLCETCFLVYIDAEGEPDDIRISEACPHLWSETHITPYHML